MHANLVKNINTLEVLTELTLGERRRLKNKIYGHGNLARTLRAIAELAEDKKSVDQNTIKRAIAGFKITPDTANKIRAFLNPETAEQ